MYVVVQDAESCSQRKLETGNPELLLKAEQPDTRENILELAEVSEQM